MGENLKVPQRIRMRNFLGPIITDLQIICCKFAILEIIDP